MTPLTSASLDPRLAEEERLKEAMAEELQSRNDPMPVFELEAKDDLSLDTLEAYRSFCLAEGLNGQAEQVDLCIDEFQAWRSRNQDLLGLPDHEHVPAS